jgi:hypothetical protein
MTKAEIGEHWQPLRSHMLVYAQGPQLTILVDPDHPAAWLSEPYETELRIWARTAEETGGYVILFCGDEVFKIEPSAKDEISALA